jgi:hypothetical protein
MDLKCVGMVLSNKRVNIIEVGINIKLVDFHPNLK